MSLKISNNLKHELRINAHKPTQYRKWYSFIPNNIRSESNGSLWDYCEDKSIDRDIREQLYYFLIICHYCLTSKDVSIADREELERTFSYYLDIIQKLLIIKQYGALRNLLFNDEFVKGMAEVGKQLLDDNGYSFPY